MMIWAKSLPRAGGLQYIRVVGCQEVGFDTQKLAEQPPKSRDEVLAQIGDNVSWGAMLFKDL